MKDVEIFNVTGSKLSESISLGFHDLDSMPRIGEKIYDKTLVEYPSGLCWL